MAEWLGNPFSSWIRGESFNIWADVMKMKTTDDEPEFAWVDVETTGLESPTDVTLELGIILTNGVGHICRDGIIDWRIFNLDSSDGRWHTAYKGMSEFVHNMHIKSGLIQEINRIVTHPMAHARLHPGAVSGDAVRWLHERVGKPLQLSGSTPHFDRAFLRSDLGGLEAWFHYRSGIDVSGTREMFKRVNPEIVATQPTKMEMHRPVPDLVDSIRLYRHLLLNGVVMNDTTMGKF